MRAPKISVRSGCRRGSVHLRSISLTLCLLMLLLQIAFVGGVSAQDSADGYVNFNFERVDIRLLVKIVGEMTGKRFIIDDKVKGSVSVVTPSKVPRSEVYPLFLSILESSGYSVLRKGGAYNVVPLPVSVLPVAPLRGDINAEEGVVTVVLTLENISAVDVAKVIMPMIRGGKDGAVSAFGPTNHLIITDTLSSIKRVETIIRQMDKPGSSRSIEVVALKYASAKEVSAQLMMAVKGSLTARSSVSKHLHQMATGGESLPVDALAIPAPQANSVIIVGTPMSIAEMKRIVTLLDIEPTKGGGRLHSIFLKYMSAVEGAKVLTSLLEKSVAEGTKSEISIEADSGSNALLVIAPAHEFKWLKELVEKIDKAPQQVMVEVLIIEVNEGKRLDMGVEWSAVDSAAEGRTTVMGRARMAETDILQNAIQKGIYPQGLAVGIATGLATDGTPLIPFLLHALGTDSDIKILSKVPIWAQDNKEASVSVVENIPILTSTIEGGAGTSRDVIQNIDRMDVGIKLELTPHVNPNKEITLKLHPSIEAIINEGPADKPFTPTIAKREVSTTVTVPDGNTIIISGLVREDKIKTIRKIPLLGDIPILGALFRYKSENARRTNLLIFVTPHLVTDMQNALQQKKKWEQATGLSESVAEEELQPGKEE